LRFDHWQNSGGFYREYDTASGSLLDADNYSRRDGGELTGRLGGEVSLSPGITATAALYRSFRSPTLNELYRPFRVGDVVTIANPTLDPEVLTGIDAGLRFGGEERF